MSGESIRMKTKDGGEKWLKNGLLHREDGPALVSPNGAQYWFWEGLFHRVGGPACIDADGNEDWCIHGKSHRVDGPARTCKKTGKEFYYLDGLGYSKEEWLVRRERFLSA